MWRALGGEVLRMLETYLGYNPACVFSDVLPAETVLSRDLKGDYGLARQRARKWGDSSYRPFFYSTGIFSSLHVSCLSYLSGCMFLGD